MVVSIKLEAPLGVFLKSLVNGFVLTKQTEGKSSKDGRIAKAQAAAKAPQQLKLEM